MSDYLYGADILGDGATPADPTDAGFGAVDTNALQVAVADMLKYSNAADAISYATDTYNNASDYLNQNPTAPGADLLTQQLNYLADTFNNSVDDSGNLVGDYTAVVQASASVEASMQSMQNQAAGTAPSVTPGGQVVQPTNPTATTTTPSPATTPAPLPTQGPTDGGDFGGYGGGDPGSIDWGDDSGSGDGSSSDDMDLPGMPDADQGIDWGDQNVDEMQELQQPLDDSAMQTPDATADFDVDQMPDDGGADPYADLLPPEEGDESEDTSDTGEMSDDEEEDTMTSDYLVGIGAAIIGGDVTIPKADVTYTDHDTVLAVQTALKAHGFDPGPLDGAYGPKTAAAIKAMQAALGQDQSGVIDYSVLMTLRVSAPSNASSSTTPRRSSGGSLFTPSAPSAPSPQQKTPSFWAAPMWQGAPVNRLQASAGVLGLGALLFGVVAAVRR